jgi:putative MATE family efflux protein
MKKPEKLYEGNMRKKYLLFAIPLILSALLSQSYSFVNSMMIGKFIGSEAFAATAVTAELIELLNSIFFGYLTGVGIYISVLYGRSEYQKIVNVIEVNLFLSLCVALLVSLGCNLFCEQIFDILNVNEEVYRNAELYFRTYVIGYIAFQFSWAFTYLSNGFGMTKLPLTASIISGASNVVLNYLFLGVLDKGIEYSAFASIISTSVTTIMYFCIYIRFFKKMGVSLKCLKFSKEILRDSFGYGAPSMFQQMTMYGCTAQVSPLTNTCSTAALSGYSIANKAKTLIAAIYQNSSKANTNFVGQAMGAGKIDKIKQGIKIGVTQGVVFFCVTMALFMIFARQFAGLFLDPIEDAQSFVVAVNIIRFLLPFIIFNVFNNLFHGIFRAVGSGTLMFISSLIYAISYVIYAYILFAVLPYEFRIYGVNLALAGAYITEVTFATIIFVSGKWKSKEYRRLEQSYQNN